MSRAKGEQPPELIRMRQRLDEFRRGTGPGVALPGWVPAVRRRNLHLIRQKRSRRTRRASQGTGNHPPA
jgi:hypothetical protein